MEKCCYNIDRRLLPVKCHYFLFFAALSCALPFRTVFAKQLGISATAVGVIFCAVPFMKIFTNPLFGFILDFFKRFRLTLTVILIFVGLSHIAMVFIPPKSVTSENRISFSEKNFYCKLTYLWSNDSSESSCHPKFVLNCEYLPKNFIARPNSFICDIQCSKSQKGASINSEDYEFQCDKDMKSEFEVFINVSDCDINVTIEKGQLSVFRQGVKNLLLFDVSNASVKETVSPLSNYCSSEQLKIIPTTNTQNGENKMNYKNKTKEANSGDNFDFTINKNGVRKYYVQNECTVNFLNKKLCANNPCSQEFDCEASRCSFGAKKIDKNIEQLAIEDNEFLSVQFWSFFILMIVSCATLSAIIFMMDAVCYELLQERKDKYGQQRLWGTIGWGVGALIGGYLNQFMTGDFDVIDYSLSFYTLGFLILIDLIPLYHLKVTNLKYSSHIWKDVCFLFTKIDIVYNIFIVYIVGILSGFIWNYQFWFMEEIGSSQVLLGLSQTFDCLFELPCFFVSGWIIEKIGHDHCNSITFLCFGLRYMCFAVMYDPWWTLAVGLFSGPTFGLFYASMTMYAKNEAPAGTEATVQSLLHLCFEGLGAATGSLLGGVGLDNFGSRMSFTYAAELSFCLLFVNILVSAYLKRVKKYSKQNVCP